MLRNTIRISAVVLGLLVIARPAVAGPPLLCHVFDIGDVVRREKDRGAPLVVQPYEQLAQALLRQ